MKAAAEYPPSTVPYRNNQGAGAFMERVIELVPV
jgi:hypothetical protein